MSTQAHPLTDLGFKPEGGHPLLDLGFQPEGEGFAKSFGATLPGYHEDDPFGAFKDLWSGAKEMVTHPGVSASLIGRSIVDPMQETYEAGSKRFAQPGAANKIAGAAEWLESGIPMIGPMLAKAGHQFESGDVGGGLGTTAGAALPMVAPSAMEGAAAIPKKLSAVAEQRVPLAQKYLNIGPELTERAVEKWQGKAADVEGKYQEKLSAAQSANETAKQTALEKQQLQMEAAGHAKDVSDHLTQLKEHEKAFGKSLYPEVEGTADAADMQGRLQNAIDSNIRGTDKPPTALARIVKELEPENPLAQASVFRGSGSASRSMGGRVNIEELPQAVQDRILRTMEERPGYQPPEAGSRTPLDFERMHGYYSELGEELGRDLSGDERAAVTAARAELLGEMRKMAESQGKLSQFTAAQKNWSKYENTFNKTWSDKRGAASPIAKALNFKDPVSGEMLPDRVAQFLGKDQNYKLAQQMLSRYDAGKPELLQLMKEKMDQAGGMPKTMKETPLPERPAPPPPVDPQALKVQALHETSQGMRSMKGIRGALDLIAVLHTLAGNPASLLYPLGRRGLSYGLESEAAMRRLTAPSEAELRMVKPTQVYMNKAAALAAKKNPAAFKGGINAQGVEASTRPRSAMSTIDDLRAQIDTMKTKLEKTANAPAEEKEMLRKQISDYQERLDDLLGKKR